LNYTSSVGITEQQNNLLELLIDIYILDGGINWVF